jgi:hypothetical protein
MKLRYAVATIGAGALCMCSVAGITSGARAATTTGRTVGCRVRVGGGGTDVGNSGGLAVALSIRLVIPPDPILPPDPIVIAIPPDPVRNLLPPDPVRGVCQI